MEKIECDRCGEICDPSEKTDIDFNEYPSKIEVCPKCYKSFKKWAKIKNE